MANMPTPIRTHTLGQGRTPHEQVHAVGAPTAQAMRHLQKESTHTCVTEPPKLAMPIAPACVGVDRSLAVSPSCRM